MQADIFGGSRAALCGVARRSTVHRCVVDHKMNVYLGEELEGKWLELH